MTFRVFVEGEEVYSTDDLVKRMSGRTRNGEAFAMNLAPGVGVLELSLERVYAGGYPDLDIRELENTRVLAEARVGEASGPTIGSEAHDIHLSTQTSPVSTGVVTSKTTAKTPAKKDDK